MRDSVKIMSNWLESFKDTCTEEQLKEICYRIIQYGIYEKWIEKEDDDAVVKVAMNLISPQIDIMQTGHWDNDYINDGKDEFNNYTYLNCTIANVSSTIIKNNNYQKYFKMSGKYKQCGDWLLYANIMQLGKVAYTKDVLNFYRVHGDNVSSVTKKEAHIKEMKQIHEYYDKTYGLNKTQKKEIQKRYKFLEKAWNLKK